MAKKRLSTAFAQAWTTLGETSDGGSAQQTLTSFLSYRAVHCANYDPEAVTPEGSGVDLDSVN